MNFDKQSKSDFFEGGGEREREMRGEVVNSVGKLVLPIYSHIKISSS